MPKVSSVERLSPSPDDPAHVVRGRARLVKAAVKLFRSTPYHETSVSDVARAAGISVGAVYLYIETKSDLLVLIFNEVVEEYRKRVLLISEFAGTASERLARAIREYYLVLDEHHAKTEIMYHEYGAIEPDVRTYIRAVEQELEAAFGKILLTGIEDGDFAPVDARLYARNVLWLGHMWALNRGSVRSEMNVNEFIEAQQRFVFDSLSPESASAKSARRAKSSTRPG